LKSLALRAGHYKRQESTRVIRRGGGESGKGEKDLKSYYGTARSAVTDNWRGKVVAKTHRRLEGGSWDKNVLLDFAGGKIGVAGGS